MLLAGGEPPTHVRPTGATLSNGPGVAWKPAVQRGWPAHQVEVVGFVDGQRFMDVTVRVDVCSHGAVQRQAEDLSLRGDFCVLALLTAQ